MAAAATPDDEKRGAVRRTERGGYRTHGKGRQEGSDEEEAGKRCTRTAETRHTVVSACAAVKTHGLAGASLFSHSCLARRQYEEEPAEMAPRLGSG